MLIDNKDALTAVDDCNYKIMSGYEWIRKQEIKKRLKEVPSADASLTQDRCKIDASSDLIDRQVVIDMLEDINAETEGVGFYYDHWVEYIKQLPSAERTGKWIHYDIGRFRCSECGKIQSGDRDSDLKFCCNCGSRNEVSE